MDTPDADEIRERLRSVADPDLGDDIVSLGLVNDITVDHDDGRIYIDLALGAPYSPTETEMAAAVRDAVDTDYDLELSATVDRGLDPDEQVLPGVKNIIAVASGKGGVGKSTVAVNLAAGLADMGARVGLFDADIYGPNVPRMMDASERPSATEDETIVPPEEHGMKLMSMDFLLGEDDPVIFRGPMVHNVLTQLWEDVEWGYLDYMIVDLPPGTGDTQLSLLQSVPVAGAVVVTTPQEVALDDARKGLRMFGEHETPVLGIVENMSTFHCPDCGGEHAIFGEGGGRRLADEVDLPFLGEIPLDPAIREGGDEGKPVVLQDGDTGEAFRDFVRQTANMQGIVHRNRERRQREGESAHVE
ncbi:Mrp/NBP35 family ATP-binding protein [Halovenus marina]|uniref:Mrp/NBP35 family ATP-binding protein n=1 Tax=Halovenus marina TaxID=3396621 RepID=UPI003F545E18